MELKHLLQMPDEAIGLSGIIERLDADVLKCFKANADKYKSRINQLLWQFMAGQRKHPQK